MKKSRHKSNRVLYSPVHTDQDLHSALLTTAPVPYDRVADRGQTPEQLMQEKIEATLYYQNQRDLYSDIKQTVDPPVSYLSEHGLPNDNFTGLVTDTMWFVYFQLFLMVVFWGQAIAIAIAGHRDDIDSLITLDKLQFSTLFGVHFSVECPEGKFLHTGWILFSAFLFHGLGAAATGLFHYFEVQSWHVTIDALSKRWVSATTQHERDLIVAPLPNPFQTALFTGFRPTNAIRDVVALSFLYAITMANAGVPNVGLQFFAAITIAVVPGLFWIVQEADRGHNWFAYVGMVVAGSCGWVWLTIQAVWTLSAYGHNANNYSVAIVGMSSLFWLVWAIVHGLDTFLAIPQPLLADTPSMWPLYIYDVAALMVTTINYWLWYYQLVNDIPLVSPPLCSLF